MVAEQAGHHIENRKQPDTIRLRFVRERLHLRQSYGGQVMPRCGITYFHFVLLTGHLKVARPGPLPPSAGLNAPAYSGRRPCFAGSQESLPGRALAKTWA